MNLLLDTCALLWALQEPKQLSSKAKKALQDSANPIYVSTVSFWEISLKASIGKLELENAGPEDFPTFVRDEGWEIIPLNATTAARFSTLPTVSKHRDPFDRMLIHLAIQENYHLVSRDAAMSECTRHGLRVCW